MEKRFQEPPGWKWDEFTNQRGLHIRTGSLIVSKDPVAVTHLGLGMGEPAEKFFETAADLADLRHNVRLIEWSGQGLSEPRLRGGFHRAANGFDHDADDLLAFMGQPTPGTAPKAYIGHSMGAMIGLLAMAKDSETIKAAALLTAFLGYQNNKAALLEFLLNRVKLSEKTLERYIPGGAPWRPRTLRALKPDDYSSDPVRMYIHDEWMENNPELRVGDLTLGGFKEACRAIASLKKPGVAESIQTPTHFFSAGQDRLVPCSAIFEIAARVPDAFHTHIAAAKHELLMETDPIRGPALQNIHNFILQHAR